MAMKQCYNRGCGSEYDPRNEQDVCVYHPGAPYFHDAYKGWSCCQNKSTDFTTFLNMKGCTEGKHSNIKPVEPEKITGNLTKEESPELVEVRAPIAEALPRPAYTTPLTRLKPTVAGSLKEQLKQLQANSVIGDASSLETRIGESCKNNGCKNTYQGEDVDYNNCKHHPGIPVFHEGLKYWSCCQRKTTEFQQFLDQEGCDIGTCTWTRADGKEGVVDCRYDWHQTATHVTVAIYAKKYDPSVSYVEVNPIRLKAHLYFPQEKGSFNLDIELKGLIAVEEATCGMFGTKLEVKLKKGESVSWAKLEIPRIVEEKKKDEIVQDTNCKVDALDLDDLDLTPTRRIENS
jgi:cysteine/histidine-rich domain-containing protein 1